MYDSVYLTSRELMRVRLYLFERQLWTVDERIHPRIPLDPLSLNLREMEVHEIITRAERLGMIFELPFAEDVLCHV